MDFAYTANSRTGQTTAGTLSAASLAEAKRQLRGQGLFPITLSAGRAGRAGKTIRGQRPAGGGRRVSKSDLLMVTAQLSVMCRTGLDVAEALQTVARKSANPNVRRVMEDVYNDVKDGKPVSAAMARHPHVFDSAYVASIAAAEASGRMADILSRLTSLMRNEIRLRSNLSAMLAYPIILLCVASTVVLALIFFVLPQFASVFEKMEAPAPPFTQLLLSGAQLLHKNLLVVLPVMVAGVIGLVLLARTEAAKRARDRLLLSLYGLRGATRSLLTGRAFQTMATMLDSGIPLLETIRLCGSSFKNRLYQELFQRLEQEVVNGEGIAETLATSEIVPPAAAEMVATAERTGQMGQVLQTVGEFFEEEGERRLRQIVRILEPAVIVVMGAIVACVVLSVVLPLLDLSSISGQ